MNGTILYQFVGSPANPLTEVMILKFFRYSRDTIKSCKSIDKCLDAIKDINVTASEILLRIDSSKIDPDKIGMLKENIAIIIQETNAMIRIR